MTGAELGSAFAALLGGRCELEWPWVFLLAPLPYLAHRYLPGYERPSPSLRVSFFRRLQRLAQAPAPRGENTRTRVRWLILGVLWLSLLLALARPVELGAPITREVSARDLLLAVDLSGSMAAIDLATPEAPRRSRLDVVKAAVGDFVRARHGDRLGLIVFGDAPFVQVPFTTDTAVVQRLMNETDVAMAGPRTALGDAVGLCLRLFQRSEAKDRVAVVLTDGNDTGSLVRPTQAARIAAEQHVRLYLVGIGDPTGLGEESLNEAVLREMASLTGGRYLHATSAADLGAIYAEIDRLEPIRRRLSSFQPRRSVAFVPLLLLGLVLAVAALSVVFDAAVELGRRRA
ncbi:MAG TPA: VWA domain-containing protein [Polyangiaceae bacterium]|nr:VWA domain-containing protein [Polyangiaceae bacterium]